MVFDRLKKAISDSSPGSSPEEYLEIDLEHEKREKKVIVKLFKLTEYEDVNDVLVALREGYTIAIIDIAVLRKREITDAKRAVSKIKKTTDALEGSIAGFGENTIIVTPSFAKIQKHEVQKEAPKNKFDEY